MGPPYAGRCLCGAVRYRVAEEPLVVYARGFGARLELRKGKRQ